MPYVVCHLTLKALTILAALTLLALSPLQQTRVFGQALWNDSRLDIYFEDSGSLLVVNHIKQICPASTEDLEISADLRQWNSAGGFLVSPSQAAPISDGNWETVQYRLSVANIGVGATFFRIRSVMDPPVIDFLTGPEELTTNLRSYLVCGSAPAGHEVWVNGTKIELSSIDEAGNFAVVVPLSEGQNTIELAFHAITGGEITRTVRKTIRADASFSTAGRRLVYVDCVPAGGLSPVLDGTVVVDLDSNSLLGFIPGLHVRGASPDGRETYFGDRSALGTDFHQTLRVLPFSSEIPLNGFLVTPDGRHHFSGDEILNVAQNQILTNRLPVNIISGSSWAGAPVPGGPAISPDGRWIFCNESLNRVDWKSGEITNTGLHALFYSDTIVAGTKNLLLISEYSFAEGRVKVYDAGTFEEKAVISGLSDFAGQLGLLGERYCVVGAGGNAAWRNGSLTVIDLDSYSMVATVGLPLADNLTVDGRSEIYVSAGTSDGPCSRIGVDVFKFEPEKGLTRVKTFRLGVNRSLSTVGAPQFDAIRRIVFKPALPVAAALNSTSTRPSQTQPD